MITPRLQLTVPDVGTHPYAPDVNAALQRIDDSSPFFPGRPASGSAPGKDKADISGAIAAALAEPDGGVVQLAPGGYDAGDLALLLPEWAASGGKSIILRGAGPLATTLKFSTNRGAGTYAIAGDGLATGQYFNVIEDIGIVGPGTVVAINSPPTDMHGIRLDSQTKLNRVGVSLFNAGIDSVGNHSEMRSVEAPNNYDALRFSVAFGLGGDILVDNCKLSGVLRASVSVASNVVATFCMIKGHLGFAPYAMFFEPTSSLSLGGTQFIGTSFEYVGNSHFYSPNKSARVLGVEFHQCGNFSRNFATYGISGQTYNPAVHVGEWVDVDFFGGMPLAAADGPAFDVDTYLMFYSDRWKASYDSAVANGVDWIKGPTSSNGVEVDLNERTLKGFTAQCFPSANIDAGMVLEWDQLNRVRPHGYYGAGTKSPIAGIALNSVVAGGREQVVVIRKGRQIPVLCDGAAASSYTLVPSTATVGKATGVVYDGTSTKPVIGPSYAAVAVPTAPSTHNVHVDL